MYVCVVTSLLVLLYLAFLDGALLTEKECVLVIIFLSLDVYRLQALIQFCYLLLQHPFHEVVHMQSANVVPPLEVEHCGQGVIQLKHGLHWKTPDLQEGSADHHSPAEDSFQGEPTTMANNEKE